MWNKITKGFRWSSLLLFNSAQEHSDQIMDQAKKWAEWNPCGGEFLAFFP